MTLLMSYGRKEKLNLKYKLFNLFIKLTKLVSMFDGGPSNLATVLGAFCCVFIMITSPVLIPMASNSLLKDIYNFVTYLFLVFVGGRNFSFISYKINRC